MAENVEQTIVVEKQPAFTQESLAYLKSAASWAKFLAILSFIGCAIMVIAGIAMMMLGSSSAMFHTLGVGAGLWGGIIYIVIGVVSFYIAFLLYKFAVDAQKAIALRDTPSMSSSLLALQRYFKINGIFTIVVIGLIIVLCIVVIAVAVPAAMMM